VVAQILLFDCHHFAGLVAIAQEVDGKTSRRRYLPFNSNPMVVEMGRVLWLLKKKGGNGNGRIGTYVRTVEIGAAKGVKACHLIIKSTTKMTASTEQSNSFGDFNCSAPEQRGGVPFVLTPPSSEILKDAQVSQQIFLSTK